MNCKYVKNEFSGKRQGPRQLVKAYLYFKLRSLFRSHQINCGDLFFHTTSTVSTEQRSYVQ